MIAQLEHGHCTSRCTVLAAPPAMVKDKGGEGGQTAVGLDPINEGVQPAVLQRGRAGIIWPKLEIDMLNQTYMRRTLLFQQIQRCP